MQKHRAILLIIVVFLSFKNVKAQSNSGADSMMTIQGCVDIALKNNLLVETSDITMQIAKVNKAQAFDNLFPQSVGISASQGQYAGKSLNVTNYTYVNQSIGSGQYSLSGSLQLFAGLYYQNTIKQNKYAFDASKMDLQNQKDNITLSVILAYYQVLSFQEQLAIAREQVDVDAKQVDRLNLQNQSGALLILQNLSDLQGQLASDQGNVVTMVSSLETAKISLFQLLNIPYRRNAQYEAVPLNVDPVGYGTNSDSIFQTAVHILPVIKSVDLKIKQFQKALAAQRGLYYPQLSLSGSVNTNYSSANTNTSGEKIPFNQQFNNDLNTYYGLSLFIPIFNQLFRRNSVKLAKINLQNAVILDNGARLTLQQTVEQDYQNMLAAYGTYKSLVDQIVAYKESFRSAEIRFNEGVITSDLYLLAKNNIDRANTNMAAAKYNYLFRTKILDYYEGRLMW
jgi:outer membrane protein